MLTSRFSIPVLTVGLVLSSWGLAQTALSVEILDDPVQIDEQAAQVVQSSNSLCWEMHRYHQQQPDYQQTYRMAKDYWRQAVALSDALQNGPVETEALQQQLGQMKDLFVRLDQSLSKWGDGDRSSLSLTGRPTTRTVVTNGVTVDLPFVGIQVGSPQVEFVEDGPPTLQRRRLHPNSRGSRRSLEREVA